MTTKRSKGAFSGKVMNRLDKLDSAGLQSYMLGLIQERGFLENVFNTIREAVIVIDSKLEIQYINKACQPLLGIGPDAIGAPISKYMKQYDWEGVIGGDWECRSWSAMRREVEVFYPEHRFLSFYVMPLTERDEHGDERCLSLATLLFNDITEVTAASEQQAENLKVKAITQLAAGVAHELGNPLNSLGIHLQLLKRGLDKCGDNPELAKARKHVEVAQQEISRLDTIVRNFLTAVRPVPPAMAPLDVSAMLQEAIEFMRTEIENRDIWVEVKLPNSIPLLLGDKDQLMQASYNLIKNAVQAMPDGGKLTISVSVGDVFVDIRFQDTGCGFDQAQMGRMMEAYFTTKSSGNGLGLIIVDRIVRAHGGELAIEGNPGKGAAFTISLPRQSRMIRQLENR